MPTNYAGSAASYPANIPVPDDGDAASATIMGPAWQRLADRNAWQKAAIEPFAYAYETALSSIKKFTTTSYVSTESMGGYLDIASCAVGDKLLVHIDTHLLVTSPFVNSATLGIHLHGYAIDDNAGTPTAADIAGAYVRFAQALYPFPTAGEQFPVHLSGLHTVNDAGTTRITLRVKLDAVADEVDLRDVLAINVIRFKA
jgi:hypothetical protein